MTIKKQIVLTILTLSAVLSASVSAQKKGGNIAREMGKSTKDIASSTSFVVPEDGKNYIVKCNFGSAKDMSRVAKVFLKNLPEGDEGAGFIRKMLEAGADEGTKIEQSKAVMKVYDSSGKMIGKKKLGKVTGFGRNLHFTGSGKYTVKIEVVEGVSGYWFLTLEYGDNS